ncbi:hypothetical protein GCM10010278_81180 [Streptomyces melanogenes]|nr:hypothetical protein GCM10010278_81180 [Streptomyces melanogenes]
MLRLGPVAVCTAALVLPLVGTGPAAAAHPHPPGPGAEEVLRERAVRLDLSEYQWLCHRPAVTEPSFHPARQHFFDLFRDVRPGVVEDGREYDGASLTRTGHLRTRPEQKVTLSATGLCAEHPDARKVGIDAEFDLGERAYRVTVLRDRPGWLRVTEEDPARRPAPTGDDADFEQPVPAAAESVRQTVRRLGAVSSKGPVVIDMIVGYTPAVAQRVGGEQAMVSRIGLAESYINRAFADSDVQASVDVIGWYNTGYYGDQTATTMLSRLEDRYDTQLGARAAELREQ